MKKFRQGQTVYSVGLNFNSRKPFPEIRKHFLHSQKTQMPPEGCLIIKMPVDFMNKMVDAYKLDGFYSL